MNEKIYPINHKGHTIYFSNWSNLQTVAEAMAAIEETTRFVEQLGAYNLLEIIDVTNSISSPSVLNTVMESARRTKPFGKRKAIVGISGTKYFVLKTVNKYIDENIQGFKTVDEALEWVIS